jgi:hypothetical protein
MITSRTPTEARARSLITSLLYVLITVLLLGLVLGLIFGLLTVLNIGLNSGQDLTEVLLSLLWGLLLGLLYVGPYLGLSQGGWFVLLQKVAHRRLARAGNLPSRPAAFLEWGIERQIFRRVGGGVRFRHNLIQQHLASTSAEVRD